MKEQNRIANIVDSKFYPLLLFFVSFVFVTLFSRSTSFLYIYEGYDAAMFKQMGLAVLKGKTMYVDYFDNKGCLLYFIHALGLWLGGNTALLIMQTISLTITLMIWDRMLALYRNTRQRWISLIVALLLLLCFYDGGDLTEEWCLPFASYPLLVCFRSLKSGKPIPLSQWLVFGLCFGTIAFIRINNACPFLGFVAFAWIGNLKEKEFRMFFKSLVCFVSGTLAIFVLCVSYFYLKGGWPAVTEMFYATFWSYFEYFASSSNEGLLHHVMYAMCLLSLAALLFANTYTHKEVLFPVMLSLLMFVLSSGSRCYFHYLQALMPCFVILLMVAEGKKHKWVHWSVGLCLCASLLANLAKPIGFLVNDVILDNEHFKQTYADFHQCITNIPETERDSIYNYNMSGICCGMMQHEGLLQCNRVFFSPLTFALPKLHQAETDRVEKTPKWILVSFDQFYDHNDACFITEHYELGCSFIHNSIYLKRPRIGNEMEVRLYRRKD